MTVSATSFTDRERRRRIYATERWPCGERFRQCERAGDYTLTYTATDSHDNCLTGEVGARDGHAGAGDHGDRRRGRDGGVSHELRRCWGTAVDLCVGSVAVSVVARGRQHGGTTC